MKLYIMETRPQDPLFNSPLPSVRIVKRDRSSIFASRMDDVDIIRTCLNPDEDFRYMSEFGGILALQLTDKVFPFGRKQRPCLLA